MKIKCREHNISTGEIIDFERDETKEETAIRLENQKRIAELEAKAKSVENDRKAIADKLGLTADELQVLLG